jgi:hypothetical protein
MSGATRPVDDDCVLRYEAIGARPEPDEVISHG